MARGSAATTGIHGDDRCAGVCRRGATDNRKLVFVDVSEKDGIWKNAMKPSIRNGRPDCVRRTAGVWRYVRGGAFCRTTREQSVVAARDLSISGGGSSRRIHSGA